jgi:hypothetical protein
MTELNTKKSWRKPVIVLFILIVLAGILLAAGCLFPAPVKSGDAVPVLATSTGRPSLTIEAAPKKYSPVMSSTPGIRLVPHATGFNPKDTLYEWNATAGSFLLWDPPDFIVKYLENPAVTRDRNVYWSFLSPQPDYPNPVIITVTARDITSGRVWVDSQLILAWEGNTTVIVP